MPTAVSEGVVQSFTYEQLMQWADLYGGSNNSTFNQWAAEAAKYGIGEEQALLDYLSTGQSGLQVERMADGTYRGWFYNSVEQLSNTNSINSNASTISRSSLRQMVGQKFETVQGTLTRNMTTFPASGGLGQQAAYVLGSIGSGVAAASTGIWLGKTIDSALYNLNPDYWNSIGLSSLNPETWNSMINGDDSPFAGLFNFILGLDPNTGKSQMYMDADTLAYMAYALAQNGWFGGSGYSVDSSVAANLPYLQAGRYSLPVGAIPVSSIVYSTGSSSPSGTSNIYSYTSNVDAYIVTSWNGSSIAHYYFFSKTMGEVYETRRYGSNTYNTTYSINSSVTINGETFYRNGTALIIGYNPTNYNYECNVPFNPTTGIDTEPLREMGYVVLFGTLQGGIDGVGNQANAVLPDVSNWTNIPSTLQSLQQQYPDAFDDAMVWDNYNDDGTANQTTWIPVPFPTATSATDTQPTSGTQTQTSTDVSQIPQTLIDLLTQIVQQTQTQTQTETDIPPINPVDTGTGSSPIPIMPTGSASALWSVYHPTQSQINDFGGWLWGSVFTTDIRKLFEDPIQGVIKLHKVFATPVDSGTGTIVVGTLDSNVSSATVTQQYVTVDCGYVDCHEDFGNVFDYPPFTEISLYLPFIGIVPLDTNDVMRSTIHVVYGVDVFTGACLAMVEVTRDGNAVNMYQYAGVCSVDYPLSNVQASNMLSGLLTMGAGIASIMASGGISAPAAGAAIGGAAATLKRSVGRSGCFSGNSGAMGVKKPYLILERPQTKVANTFPRLAGYPTNYSCKLSDCSNQVVVKHVHVEGIPATDTELSQIETLLKNGILI